MGSHAKGVNCGVVEWVKRNALRWFGYIERMGSEQFVKKVNASKSVGPHIRGRPPGRWRDRVKECMCERGATRVGKLDQARRECLDRERWRFFCRGYPIWWIFLETIPVIHIVNQYPPVSVLNLSFSILYP